MNISMSKRLRGVIVAAILSCGFMHSVARGDSVLSDGVLSATISERGEIQEMTWNRPGTSPVAMAFRHDKYAGFSWHVCIEGQWQVRLPLERVKSDAHEFALTMNGIVYSLAYAVKDGRLEVLAGIQNKSGKVFAPERALVNFGVDTEMAKFPDWNERFFPTLLRCEKTHFWGYFMRPDGVILAVASPDPVVSWANGYNDGGHRLFTSCLDFLNTAPQPARHPHVPQSLAPGESRQWRVVLAPLDNLTEVQPTLAKAAGIPMIALDRPTVEAGQMARGVVTSPAAIKSFSVAGPDGNNVPSALRDGTFSFQPEQAGVYAITVTTQDEKVAEALVARRMPWSWYAQQARASAVAKPQKASTHTESWYGLFSGYIARRYFPDGALDAAIDAKFAELAPLMYDVNNRAPKFHRVQNDACWASLLVDRYEATGDIASLEFAAALADYLIANQSSDGAYRNGKAHYTCVVYIAKSVMEVMEAERALAEKDSVWKARYDRHAASVRLAVDDLAERLDNIGTEGEATYEDGMISCEFTQLAMYALLQTDPGLRQKYLAAAKKVTSGHRCLSQILIPDCRMNGGSLRYWESQYDVMTHPNMLNSPHGWSAWQFYGLWYLYQLTGEKEYLRQAMNGLSSCVQLIDFKTGDLRWAFVPDPCVHARVFEQDPANPGKGIWNQRVIGEQYLPMISGWYRAAPSAYVTGYFGMDGKQEGGCCDNDVHEIFKCLGEIALTSAYVVENPDGTLETWNCTVSRGNSNVLEIMPAEAVVERVHVNLKAPHPVRVAFAAGPILVECQAGLAWLKR